MTLSDPTAGALSTPTVATITPTYNAGTGVWTASGTPTNLNLLLANPIVFTPATNYNSNFTIATSVSDGSLSVTGSKAMTATAVNDAPSATNLSTAEVYTRNTNKNMTAIVVSDVDSATLTVTLTLSDPLAGGLSTQTVATITSSYNAISGVWTATGTPTNLNSLLADASLYFTPATDYGSPFSITTNVSDGALSVSGSKAFTTTPGQVTGLAASVRLTSMILTWTAVTSDPVVTDYVVQYKLSAAGSWSTFADGTSTSATATVTGLTTDSPYDFRVSATNSAGTGVVSSTVTATPAWTPAEVATTMWWDFNDLTKVVLTTGDGVTENAVSRIKTITDKSGNGRNGTANTTYGDQRPLQRLAASNVNGKNCARFANKTSVGETAGIGFYARINLRFDGTQFVGTNWFICHVIARRVSTQMYYWGGDTPGSNNIIAMQYASAGTHFTHQWNGSDYSSTGNVYSYERPEIVCSQHAGSVNSHYFNGTLGSGTKSGVSNLAGYAGAAFGGAPWFGGNWYLDGDVCEVVCFNRIPGTTERQNLETYLARKWGITSRLPVGHPGYAP